MAAWSVPLADLTVSEDDIAAIAEVYRSGWLSMGPRTEDFERDQARFAGVRQAIAVSSGTAALHLMYLAAGLGAGDEVIVPSLTFVATVNAITYTGATPVFADAAGLQSPWLSAKAVEAAITPRTRAIVAMPYGGYPGEIVALRELATRRGVPLLEDAAHAMGARVGGRHLGTFGLAGAFSFFANKNLAVGEGGAVVTDDDQLAATARLLRSHGITTLTWDRHRGHAAGYDVVALGFNYRIDEPRAALAARRLTRLDADTGANGAGPALSRGTARCRGRHRDGSPARGPRDSAAHHLFTVVVERRSPATPYAPRSPRPACRRASITHRRTASRSTRTMPPTCRAARRTVAARSRCRCSRG
jgi:dTDP-4-amino-4,6-dideoxygalactose transaminase